MLKELVITIFYFCILVLNTDLFGQEKLIASWNFDDVQYRLVKDNVTNLVDTIKGNYKIVDGIVGKALKCDGFTTLINRNSGKAPKVTGAFSIEGWIAPQAYPWNWCAIVNQEYDHQRGFFFGIDAEGRIGLHAAINRQWRECISDRKIPFMEWSHVAATFNPLDGITLFINGVKAGYLDVQGDLLADIKMDLQIGRNHKKMIPASLNRAGKVKIPSSYSFDGLIDELKIYSITLTQEEIKNSFEKFKANEKPKLKWRKLPEISTHNSEFGGFYTNLKYDEDWDALWKDDKFPDVVVTFDDAKYSMVFWKGTNYNLNLVTENGKWIADQSAEGGGPETQGCCEHMSDKQNRYSHIRMIENSNARVVIHWRYALTDVTYQIANVDPVTGWGDWVDEYYYIYPDGIAVRHFAIHGKNDEYSITEPTVLSNPGEKAEDNVDLKAVSLANLKGETHTYSFETWPTNGKAGAEFINPIYNPILSVVNLKSDFKPFYIYESGTRIIPYGGGIKEIDYGYSHFHSRNHWPITQIPCDGRFVLAADQVTSSAITSPEPPMMRRAIDNALEGRFVMGLSNKPIDELIPFASFWINTPKIEIISDGFSSNGFNRNERAFGIHKNIGLKNTLNLKIAGSKNSPVVNPVFIIENWGKSELELLVDDKELSNGINFRYSIRKSLEKSDLIVWIKMNSQSNVKLSFVPLLN